MSGAFVAILRKMTEEELITTKKFVVNPEEVRVMSGKQFKGTSCLIAYASLAAISRNLHTD
jgi:hypothetical protein